MRMTERAERGPDCLSRLQCDQLLNGELADRDDLARHHAGCARCTALLAAHRDERAGFAVPRLAELPALARPRAARRWPAGLAAVAAALGVWLVASRGRDGGDEVRSKGGLALTFYVKHGDAVRAGGAGERVQPDDAINFAVSTARPGFLAIISIDGAGKLSTYYPEAATAEPIAAGAGQVLPRSVRLDDTLGLERVIGVLCDRPAPVAELAAAAARDALPTGCVADRVTLDKRRAP